MTLQRQHLDPRDLEPHDDRLLGVVAQIPAVDARERRDERAALRGAGRLALRMATPPVFLYGCKRYENFTNNCRPSRARSSLRTSSVVPSSFSTSCKLLSLLLNPT